MRQKKSDKIMKSSVYTTESSRVQKECDFLIEYDVKYGSDESEVLDIYYKDTTAKSKCCKDVS